MMKNFDAYQLSLKLYRDTKRIQLPDYLKDQLQRAASSICLNLSEGSAKPTVKDRRKYYFTALGSCREVQTLIQMENLSELVEIADQTAAHIYKLTRS